MLRKKQNELKAKLEHLKHTKRPTKPMGIKFLKAQKAHLQAYKRAKGSLTSIKLLIPMRKKLMGSIIEDDF